MTPLPNSTPHRHRVALVDDDEDLRLLLRSALEVRGFEVIEFESTEEALGWERPDILSSEPPIAGVDLILLDVGLPGVSGVETIELLKQTPAIRRTPIAMLTARAESETVLKCIKAGAADYFIKPLDFPEVMRRIERLLADPSGAIQKSAQSVVSWNFQEFLIRELKRAERSEQPLGLILGAVRRISQRTDPLNEDEIAALWSMPTEENSPSSGEFEAFLAGVRRKLREYDLLAPFGAAEFAVVLPDIPSPGTAAAAAKIHEVFESGEPFPLLPRREQWVLLTGSANSPEDGKDRLALFCHAERRLSERPPVQPKPSTADDAVYLRTVRCPSCAKRHAYPKAAARRLTPIARESDFRLVYDGVDPILYSTAACPHCGFSVLESDWRRVARLEAPAFRWKYRRLEAGDEIVHRTVTLLPKELAHCLAPPWEAWLDAEAVTVPLHQVPERFSPQCEEWVGEVRSGRSDPENLSQESALAAHLLARETYEVLGASPLRRARLAHRIAWLHRIAEDKFDEQVFLEEALDLYKAAFHFEEMTNSKLNELEMLFLIGELSFRVGREENAVAIFENLVRDPRVEERQNFKKMIHRRWYEARNEPLP